MKTRILLVEDNPATRDVMTQELQLSGYDVVVADNGVQAVEMATSKPPDLIVMDISLPQMDGFKATARLKADPKTRSVPILAATARTLPEDREKCLASGFDDYIAKPFTHRELNAHVVRLLKNKVNGNHADGAKKKRVLITDDNPDFSRLVRSKLVGTGKYEVRVEDDGSSGISAARALKPDLILLDVMMPELDGPEVAERGSAEKDMAHIPIVMLGRRLSPALKALLGQAAEQRLLLGRSRREAPDCRQHMSLSHASHLNLVFGLPHDAFAVSI